ncbi:MAG: DUF4012 domain-containing protein, partial [Anaerolineaceae bacterium]|nr:DUF4012 domain-containing protein [Anaerolineaceae bacterium]
LQIDRGKITALEIGDSYRVDDFSKGYPSPPDPIARFMLAGYWVPRDANWSPDFPTTARQAQELYTLSTGTVTQGVVAFDQSAIRAILTAVGPIELPGESQPVTPETVEAYMQAAWGPASAAADESTWFAHRKDFMAVLGKTLIGRILAQRDPTQMLKLAAQALALIEQGHLAVYSSNPAVQSALARSALDGSLTPAPGDFLMLVDANIGFNKMDAVIQRSLTYQVDLRDLAHPLAHLSVQYINPVQQDVACVHQASYGADPSQYSYQNMQQRCYWDYWRAYFPAGTNLVSSQVPPISGQSLLTRQDWSGLVDSSVELPGLQTFGGLVMVPTRQQQVITLDVALPAAVVSTQADGGLAYHLRLRKQPGLDTLTVNIDVRLPDGARLLPGTTPGTQPLSGVWSWRGNLSQSTSFVVAFSAPPAQ